MNMKIKDEYLPDMKFKLEGWYTLEVKRADGSVRKKLRFKNLITNVGLDMLGGLYPELVTSTGFPILFCGCDVGTGSAAPAFSDTKVQSFLAGSRNPAGAAGVSAVVVGPPYYFSQLYSFTFGTGVAAGNITELCVGSYSSLTPGQCTAFSRALILDGGGAPTTLTVLSTEILVVTYELRTYVTTADTAYSLVQGATTYTGVMRPVNASNAPGPTRSIPFTISLSVGTAIAAFTNPNVTGTFLFSNTGSGTFGPYIAGSYSLGFSWTWSAASASGTMGAWAVFGQLGDFQFSVSPAVVKGSGQSLQIQGAYSWARM